jgi:hypothetical protein
MTPTFQPTPLRCARCGHRWTGHIAVHCSISVAVAVMQAVADEGCPACCALDPGAVLIVTGDPALPPG